MSFNVFNRVNGLPLTIFVLLSSLFLFLGWYLESQEQQSRESKARVVAQQVASSIEVFAADRRRALKDLMITWPDYHPNPVDWFQAHAKTLQYVLPGFDDIIWANPQQRIVWSINPDYRDSIKQIPLSNYGLNFDATEAGEFATALKKREDSQFYVFIARAINPYELEHGYVAASFDIRSTLFVMVGELVGGDFSLAVSDGGQVLKSNNQFDVSQPVVHQPVSFAGRDWTLSLQADRPEISPGAVLAVLGVLMSSLIAFFLHRQLKSAFRLNLSQERYRAASESALDAILVFAEQSHGQDFDLVEANQVARQLFSANQLNFKAYPLSRQLERLELESLMMPALEVCRSGAGYEKTVQVHSRWVRAEWIKIQIVKAGQGIAVTVRDITADYHNQQALEASEAKFRRLVENLNGHFIYSHGLDGEVSFVSNSVTDILGYSPDWFRNNHDQCIKTQPQIIKMVRGQLLMGVRPDPYIVEYYTADGEIRQIEYRDSPVFDDDHCLVAIEGIGRDVTQDLALQRKVSYQANHDQLTGLFNRYAFDRQLRKQLQVVAKSQQASTLCYIDMDKFKLVNDTCGHQAGDELLRQVSGLLQSAISEQDILARVGGDEFCLVLPELGAGQAEPRLQQLLNLIREFRFAWGDNVFHIGASIGVVEMNDEGRSAGELIKAADHACYQAKSSGRNRYCIYDSNDKQIGHRQDELRWVNDIQKALHEDRFELFHQVIEPLSQPVRGKHYEILVRMVDEQGDYVSPGIFIPMAEQHGLMTKIDEWVFEHTLTALEQHPEHVEQLDKCAINLSGVTLGNEAFLDKVIAHLHHSSVPAEKLCFEITETAAVTNLSLARHFIDSLRALGCQFALDDFGAGMSSFTYLKNMAVDYVKIDGSFVRNLAQDKSNYVTVKAIHEIASSMHKQTVAEFVTDEQTRQLLIQMGIGYGQGFALGKPAPLMPMLKSDSQLQPRLRVV
ncbi:Cellulose synthesis regulatory protein [Saliniradius amylolyticus]|uniref:Cellulose synthesis regulatory protein n=1 Tax=Saliniradius amylolyticus TaxID=2183582 RepID=A0A2S2E023_9ALTE|nr:EAL domain-containing protein [Saliniradius amylolyticus]AWL10998.1 Cellulose synthesis regulatory protein [Saliniradius amylolyticus]